MITLTCSVCGRTFTKLRKRGSMDCCLRCMSNKRVRRWVRANPEQVRTQKSYGGTPEAKTRYEKTERGQETRRGITERAKKKWKDRYASDPQFRRAELNKQGARRYGVTVAEYERLASEPCAICGSAEPNGGRGRMHIDHDHVSGRIRGTLCARCNIAIGLFDDDVSRLAAAAKYLTDANA